MVPALPPKRMLGGKPVSLLTGGLWRKRNRGDAVENKCLQDQEPLLLLGSENIFDSTLFGGVNYCQRRNSL